VEVRGASRAKDGVARTPEDAQKKRTTTYSGTPTWIMWKGRGKMIKKKEAIRRKKVGMKRGKSGSGNRFYRKEITKERPMLSSESEVKR